MKSTIIQLLISLGVAMAQRHQFRQSQLEQYRPTADGAGQSYSALKNRPIVVQDAEALYQTTAAPSVQYSTGAPQYSTPAPAGLPVSLNSVYSTPIPILRYNKQQSIDGSYKASYETGNNIVAEETGFLKNVGIKDQEALVQHGSYSYTSPDGVLITVTYTADEGGFRASGDHLPTPPPVPAEIQKSLDIIYEQIRLQAEEEARKEKYPKPAADINSNTVVDSNNYNSRF